MKRLIILAIIVLLTAFPEAGAIIALTGRRVPTWLLWANWVIVLVIICKISECVTKAYLYRRRARIIAKRWDDYHDRVFKRGQ